MASSGPPGTLHRRHFKKRRGFVPQFFLPSFPNILLLLSLLPSLLPSLPPSPPFFLPSPPSPFFTPFLPSSPPFFPPFFHSFLPPPFSLSFLLPLFSLSFLPSISSSSSTNFVLAQSQFPGSKMYRAKTLNRNVTKRNGTRSRRKMQFISTIVMWVCVTV